MEQRNQMSKKIESLQKEIVSIQKSQGQKADQQLQIQQLLQKMDSLIAENSDLFEKNQQMDAEVRSLRAQ